MCCSLRESNCIDSPWLGDCEAYGQLPQTNPIIGEMFESTSVSSKFAIIECEHKSTKFDKSRILWLDKLDAYAKHTHLWFVVAGKMIHLELDCLSLFVQIGNIDCAFFSFYILNSDHPNQTTFRAILHPSIHLSYRSECIYIYVDFIHVHLHFSDHTLDFVLLLLRHSRIGRDSDLRMQSCSTLPTSTNVLRMSLRARVCGSINIHWRYE